MTAFHTPRILAIAIAAVSLSACDYGCGTVGRTIANGTVRDAADVTLGTAQVDLSDNLRPTFLRLSVGVNGSSGSAGAPLRGHVTRARLVEEGGALIAEIPVGTGTLFSDGVVALNMDLPSDEEYARVRTALLTALARVILDTDLLGREHIETILSDAHDVPANLGRCSIS